MAEYPTIKFAKVDESVENQHFHAVTHDLKSAISGTHNTDEEIKELARGSKDVSSVERAEINSKIKLIQNSSAHKLAVAKKLVNKPYFARMDFLSHDSKRIMYISKGSLGDVIPGRGQVKYINWRAPAADLYYRYNNSAISGVSYQSPSGEIRGDIVLTSRFKIKKNSLKITSISDIKNAPKFVPQNQGAVKSTKHSNIDVGNNFNPNSHRQKHRDETKIKLIHLQPTQDTEQNDIIRCDPHDTALQEKLAKNSTDKMTEIVETIQSEQNDIIRRDPHRNLIIQGGAGSGKTAVGLHRAAYLLYDNLKDYNLLFISPNPDFSEYISEVLPELGELNIPIKTFDDIFDEKFCSRKSELGNIRKPPASIFETIEKYFKRGEVDPDTQKLYSSDMDESFVNVNEAIQKIRKMIVDYYKATTTIKNDSNRDLSLVGEPMDLLRCDFERVWNHYCGVDIDIYDGGYRSTRRFEPRINISRHMDFVFYAITESLVRGSRYRNVTHETVYTEKGTINQQTPTREVEHEIKHIIIDEAQDYTKWHIYLLHLLCPEATFTILGDKNQNVNPYIKTPDLKDLLSKVTPSVDYVEINKAYRSSPEIVEYTDKIIDANIQPVRISQNHPVILRKVSSWNDAETMEFIRNDIEKFIRDGFKKLAIITRSKQTAEIFDKIDKTWLPPNIKISILPVYEAKGLEFDAIIAINDYKDNEREMFYNACTRAQHELAVYSLVENETSDQDELNADDELEV